MKNLYYNSKEKLYVGRASTGIYLILKNLFKNAEVLVPANICYAAVYPIVYSGNKPKFCDVDISTGNITFEIFKSNMTENVKATIIPHMYGNPVIDIKKISDYCKQKNIILIEDCASSMGVIIDNKVAGSYGDYSIFSTGYSKTLDLGYGGFILTNNDLYNERQLYSELPFLNDSIVNKISAFSKKYRIFRNSKNYLVKEEFLKYSKTDLSDLFLHKINPEYRNILEKSLDKFEEVLKARVLNNLKYDKYISYSNDILKEYVFLEGSVPWRKNIFVDATLRDRMVSFLLKNNVPVSDWYPSIAIMFEDYNSYDNITLIENSILNFPVLIGDREIKNICNIINSFCLNGGKIGY